MEAERTATPSHMHPGNVRSEVLAPKKRELFVGHALMSTKLGTKHANK